MLIEDSAYSIVSREQDAHDFIGAIAMKILF